MTQTNGPEMLVTSVKNPGLQQQVAVSSLKAAAADPRTTNALLLILVLCVSGYMPESLATLCGA